MHTRLIQVEPNVRDDDADRLRPERGLFATYAQHGHVLVVDTFTWRSVPYADICRLNASWSVGGEEHFSLGEHTTCRQDELQNVQLNF